MYSAYVRRFAISIAVFLLCWLAQPAASQASKPQNAVAGDALIKSFADPPQSARPLVWWHWMNGNVSKEGIKLDLEWMHRIGLGGFQTFEAGLATPQVVPKRLLFMTPEWKDAFNYATVLADQLGLQEAISGSPGWSEAGGPWVPAREAMKKYVWSETVVEGGKPFTGKLIHPPTTTGPYQNLASGHEQNPVLRQNIQEPTLYEDSAVVAFPMPAGHRTVLSLHPEVTVSVGTVDAERLNDGDLNTAAAVIPKAANPMGDAWIQYAFHIPQTIRSMTIGRIPGEARDNYFNMRSGPPVGAILESGDDGVSFHTVMEIPKVIDNGTEVHTLSFAPVTAKYFRLILKTVTPCTNCANAGQREHDIAVSEFELHEAPRVNHLEEKAAFIPVNDDLELVPTPEVSSAEVIEKNSVIDLTSRMHPDGTLDWTPPAGQWVVLRIGYSLLGITNHPAPPEATGLEVDKLNAAYVKDYVNQYMDLYKGAVGQDYMGHRGIRSVVSDSWEAGAQNWTDDMIPDFIRLRDYDPHPWLPVLAGYVVQSAKASDQFLWDLRKTIADLTADEFYGQLETSLKSRGIGHFGEAHENGRHFIADGMEVKKYDDVPMGAMWVPSPKGNAPPEDYDADDRESASVAHIYGQNLAAAESLTTGDVTFAWFWSPATLKPTADRELANGINLFAIHESAQQPLLNKAPGMTLGNNGQWFNRNETWAQEAGPWVDYLARSSYLLQQGRFAADILYFYGEDSNLTAIFHTKGPDVPEGYQFDYINADALIHMLNVDDGRITTTSGMSYRVLALDPYSAHMSLPVLRAIYKLVEQGAVVAGTKPIDDPSLADDQAEFNKLNKALFGNGTGIRRVGRGEVFAGQDAAETLKTLGVAPDFEHSMPQADTHIDFVHRKLPDGDIYFLDSRSDREITVDASFRVTGREPELWHAETGKSEPASYTSANGRTAVPLHLEPWETVFVVFRKPANASSRSLPRTVQTQLANLEGSWELSFQPDRGAPASIALDKLSSWSDNPDPGVKYFSGTGTYTKTISAKPDWFKPGAKIWIDLGGVKNLADVSVNGKSLGVVWHAPYRVDATAALKPGSNEVVIKVINAWVNRLIGDQQPNAAKYTFADITPYKVDSPLAPSGLLGPVTVVCETAQDGAIP